ncbi:MAG: DUF4382 domain-containing protein [Cyanobacteria bacterium J06628_6]
MSYSLPKRLRSHPLLLGCLLGLASCGLTEPAAQEPTDTGTLVVQANGEDFVRQGFTTKDGWAVAFDTVEVTLDNISAYQADPAFDPDTAKTITSAQAPATIVGPVTVDLAAGDESADPVLVGEVETVAGRYNALTWALAAADRPALVMVGTATRDGQTIPFNIAMDPALRFVCGDFVGEERKGFLDPSSVASVEATFHFDHLFGDAELSPDDELNQGALGFAPFATLATSDGVSLTPEQLAAELPAADYQRLQSIFKGLGHVGEGHCLAEAL